MPLRPTRLIAPVALAALALAGCMPVPPSDPVQPVLVRPTVAIATPVATPAGPYVTIDQVAVGQPVVASASGLQERQPDLCGAKAYVPWLGQPGSVVPGLGITRPYRVVEYRGIEPQEYDPQRVVFRLDAAGSIVNIDCG